MSTLSFPSVTITSPVFSCNKLTSMWLILFQSLLVFLDISNGIFYNKAEKQLWSSISLFHAVLRRKNKRAKCACLQSFKCISININSYIYIWHSRKNHAKPSTEL
jgi:hypothetical protein